MIKDKPKPQKPEKRRRPIRKTLPSKAFPNAEGCTCVGHIGAHSTYGCLVADCRCRQGAL